MPLNDRFSRRHTYNFILPLRQLLDAVSRCKRLVRLNKRKTAPRSCSIVITEAIRVHNNSLLYFLCYQDTKLKKYVTNKKCHSENSNDFKYRKYLVKGNNFITWPSQQMNISCQNEVIIYLKQHTGIIFCLNHKYNQ